MRIDASPGTVQKAPTRYRLLPLVLAPEKNITYKMLAPRGLDWTEEIMQKRNSSAAAAAAAAAGVVLGSALGRLELCVNGLLVEALVVEFALLGVAEDVQRLAEPLEDLGFSLLDFWRRRCVPVRVV